MLPSESPVLKQLFSTGLRQGRGLLREIDQRSFKQTTRDCNLWPGPPPTPAQLRSEIPAEREHSHLGRGTEEAT